MPDSKCELQELQTEAKYYLVQELVDIVEVALNKRRVETQPSCRVPLITSAKEEQQLIASTTRPVVKLLCNRHNNKYSYTRFVGFVVYGFLSL